MQAAGDGGLAGAGLTLNQDRRQPVPHPLVCRQDSLQLAFQRRERLTEEKLPFRRVTPTEFIQSSRPFAALGPSDDQRQFGRLERFDQVVGRPKAHGLHRAADTPPGGHDHDTRVGREDSFLQQVGPASVRKVDVEQDEIELEFGNESFGGPHRVGAGHVGAEFVQVSRDLLSEQRLVLHDQDAQTGQRYVLHVDLVGQIVAFWRQHSRGRLVAWTRTCHSCE